MSIYEYGAMAPIALMSANECSGPHGTILITSHQLSRVLMVPQKQAYEHSWLLHNAHEHSLTLISTKEHS